MTSQELKKKFIEFFVSKGHVHIPNSSVIPENDPSALFINSGMHPLVPYLLGEPHPSGKTRLVNYQRAVRTGDIEEVGDNTHHTFFEMLGEWSLGDYGKKESIEWTFEFLTQELGFDPKRLHPSVFRGNSEVPRDEEAIEIWKDVFTKIGLEADVEDNFNDSGKSARIIALGEDDNFWKVGSVGPCGPTSEVYYDRGLGENADQRYLEVCNNVFMSYNMTQEGELVELKQKNIDVGWGFERLVSVVQNIQPNGDIPLNISPYETDLFNEQRVWLINNLQSSNFNLQTYDENPEFRKAIRTILDHIRASVMIIADGIVPSNKDQGYVLRRLIRRAATFVHKAGIEVNQIHELPIQLADKFIDQLGKDPEYTFLIERRDAIKNVLKAEVIKFQGVLKNGIKELNKIQGDKISGEIAFRLKEALGLPLEITEEIAGHQGKIVDTKEYERLMDQHQEKSRTAAVGKFVGGLGDHSPESIRLHTCAHILLAGAQKLLGEHVHQKGQNITPERLRYDIAHSAPLTEEQIKILESWVNDQIEKELIVDFVEMSVDEANKLGAEGVFGDKYAKLDKVKVYRMYEQSQISKVKGKDLVKNDFISLELCGGPHVDSTKEIKDKGRFKIVKEESSSQGVRRIKAIIE
jgi:alanyl-tRNA synthetase